MIGFGRRQKYFVRRLLGINQTESQSEISPGLIISFESRWVQNVALRCGLRRRLKERMEDTCYPFQF